MQLSAKTQNACLAMLELARRHADGQLVSLKTIAEAQGISSPFLVQILLQLKRAGLVQSVRGASGGYRLARVPSAISLLDVIQAMDGLGESTPPPAATPTAQVLQASWQTASEQLQASLSNVTLSTLAARIPQHAQDMYYI